MTNATPYIPDYSIAYGSRYDRALSTTDIAKLVRRDIRAAMKDGTLPPMRVSVRTSYYAGGSSIRLEVKACDFQIQTDEFIRHQRETPCRFWDGERMTADAVAVLDALKAITGAYNFDGSDSMVDYFHVNFYSNADFDHALLDAERSRCE